MTQKPNIIYKTVKLVDLATLQLLMTSNMKQYLTDSSIFVIEPATRGMKKKWLFPALTHVL